MSGGAPLTVGDLSAAQTDALKHAVRTKIAEIDAYADASLTDYVMVLLANKHGPERVIQELEDFLSPMLVESFVSWLFGKCGELRRSGEPVLSSQPRGGEKKTTATATATTTTMTMTFSRASSAEDGRSKGGRRIFERALRTVDSTRMDSGERVALREKRFSTMQRRSRSPPSDRRERRRRSRSPDQRQRRNARSPPSRTIKYQSLNSRLADELEGRGRRRSARRRGFPEEDVVDARELLTNRRRDQRIVRRIDNNRVKEDDEEKEFLSSSRGDTKRTRCTYWPNCKAGDACPYAHPSETCKHFPNCAFGEKCINLHPAIPCKFQDLCTNPDCNYQHSSPATMGRAGAPAAGALIPPSPIPCRFYPNCRNANCPFMHPSTTACRFAEKCQRPACPFTHPEGRALACKAFVNAPCRYGRNCAKTDCPFQHAASPMETSPPPPVPAAANDLSVPVTADA